MMRAIEISVPGPPNVLQLAERPIPVPGPGQVVLKIAYAGVNRPDALQRAGLYNPPAGASDLPGLEASGVIAACGAGVLDLQQGQQVCALLPGGGYAEYAVTQAAHCLPVPSGFDLKQAACLPETFFTVWSNVFQRGGLLAGERILVHGGSSGIVPRRFNWRGRLARGCSLRPALMPNVALVLIWEQSGRSITARRTLC